VTTSACTVLIAAADLLAELQRSEVARGEVLAFAEGDALGALEAITTRRPDVIALEAVFASSPRGTALIHRVRADPDLCHAEIRLLTERGETVATQPPEAAAAPASLDRRGTRRAARVRIAPNVEVLVDGHAAALIDLSTLGAQVVRTGVLKPNQRVRLALGDDEATIRMGGVVAWASYEIPPGQAPRYRAGIEFSGADEAAVDAFCSRHQE
jgi:CHASE2 domain-containing sensor protein